jgi:hypothetical protein
MVAPSPPYVMVTRLREMLMIEARFPSLDHIRAGDLQLILEPGDCFGGRRFDEWAAVADGTGYVTADWLMV